MSTSPDKKSAFGLSAEQIGRLLSIGSGDDTPGAPCEDKSAYEHASSPAPAEKAPGRSEPSPQIEGYEIIEKVAEAGQGQVWRALQMSTGRDVAIKVPRVGSVTSERSRLRFEREIELAARLNHPNIARIYDSGVDRGQYYYVMDFIKGANLDEYVRQKKLTHREILELMRTICLAVQHAHQNGVIHRDLKPSNILVTDDGRPYIVDFGLAKALVAEETGLSVSMDGETVGTPAYMSPEQAAGRTDRLDTRTDVYSLGVILFHLLTGQSPHDLTGSRQEVLHRIALGQVNQPRQVCPGIDRELEWLLLKALDQDPDRRYSSAGGLAEDIHNYLDGAPLVAGPPSATYRIKKFVKRNRTLVAATALVAVTIGIGIVVSLAMYVRAQIQAQRSKAVSAFLNDTVLRALDPFREQGGPITALSVLDAVATGINSSFRDAPLLEAEVRHRLGRTYAASAQHEAAVQNLQRALDIRRRELGSRHPLTLETMHQLAWASCLAGRAQEAEPLFLWLLAEHRRQFGEEDARTISINRMLAYNYARLREYETARQLFQDTLNTARRALGYNHELAISPMVGIAFVDIATARYDDAERWFGKALASSRHGLGPDHAWTHVITGGLGLTHMLQGRYPEAERMLLESIAGQTRVFGETNWQTVASEADLVCLYVAWDRLKDAAKWRARLVATTNTDPCDLSGSVQYDQRTESHAIQGSGMDIWDVFDEFHFAHKTLRGDGSITARIDSIENVDVWTKAGIMIRKTLEPTSEHASVFISPTGVVTFQWRSTQRGAGAGRQNSTKLVEFPHWVRLTRRGNAFMAEHSSDGVSWEEVRNREPSGSGSVEVAMDQTVHVGLALTSHDAGRKADAQISHVTFSGSVSPKGPFTISEDIGLQTMLPSPFGESTQVPSVDSNDIGTRSTSSELTPDQIRALSLKHGGSAGSLQHEEAADTYTILGSGADIWNRSDEFHFAWKKLMGDGAIVARVESVQNVSSWTKAGVMIRNTLEANSQHAMVLVTPSGRVSFQRRTAAGGECQGTWTAENMVTLPHWVKLFREGNMFRAQHSTDGIRWRDLEGVESMEAGAPIRSGVAEVPMNESAYVGLAVTSHTAFLTAEAKMSHVSVTGKVDPPGEFLWSEDIGFQMIMLPKK